MKTVFELPEDAVDSLRPGDMQLYLRSRGWVGEPYGPAGKGLRFTNPAVPKADLLLPLKRDLRDYAERMSELVSSLAAIEERPVREVFNDLSMPSGDILRIRICASDAMLGNLPLDEGIKLLQGGRDLLAAAANSALRPQPFHSQTMPKPVAEFLATCRLGQTERGSFIATIITPVPPEIQHSLGFREDDVRLGLEPYPRQVTTRLMTTLELVVRTTQNGGNGIALEAAVQEGVSANLCDALKLMKPSGDLSTLDVSMGWARTRGPIPKTVPTKVSFPQESFGWIEEVARTLRMRPQPRFERFQGKLIQVSAAQRPLFKEVAGMIQLRTEINGAAARVRVDLARDDFRAACDALRDGKEVAVTGIIRHEVKAREYELAEPRNFEVITET